MGIVMMGLMIYLFLVPTLSQKFKGSSSYQQSAILRGRPILHDVDGTFEPVGLTMMSGSAMVDLVGTRGEITREYAEEEIVLKDPFNALCGSGPIEFVTTSYARKYRKPDDVSNIEKALSDLTPNELAKRLLDAQKDRRLLMKEKEDLEQKLEDEIQARQKAETECEILKSDFDGKVRDAVEMERKLIEAEKRGAYRPKRE